MIPLEHLIALPRHLRSLVEWIQLHLQVETEMPHTDEVQARKAMKVEVESVSNR